MNPKNKFNSNEGCSNRCGQRNTNLPNPFAVEYHDPRHILAETNITEMLKKVTPGSQNKNERFQYDFSRFPLKKSSLEECYLPNCEMIRRSDYLRGYFKHLCSAQIKKDHDKNKIN